MSVPEAIRQAAEQTIRVARAPSWGAMLLQFVMSELPNLLNNYREGQEADALEELAKLYRARRTEHMADRRAEIGENRAEVDAALAERSSKAKRDK